MTITLPHTFGTATPQPPEMMSFLDDNFNALLNAVNAILGGTSTSSVIALVPTVNRQTGATYTVNGTTDKGNLVTFTNAGAIAVTLPQAVGAFAAPWFFYAECLRSSTGSATITPTTSTIDGLSSIVLQPGGGVLVITDPTGNYAALRYTTKGQQTPGTTNTLDPWATSTTQSLAHGLSATPTVLSIYFQCKIAEHGYNIGDVVMVGQHTTSIGSGQVWTISADATNTYIVTNNFASNPGFADRTTGATFNITPANWKLVVTPYAFT